MNKKLTQTDVMRIRVLHDKGVSRGDLAIRFNVSISNIARIVTNQTWKNPASIIRSENKWYIDEMYESPGSRQHYFPRRQGEKATKEQLLAAGCKLRAGRITTTIQKTAQEWCDKLNRFDNKK